MESKKSMKNELIALNRFCKVNGIDYVLTGTLALSILGIPLKHCPGDIDIIVTKINACGYNKLREQMLLSGNKQVEDYDTTTFTFNVAGTKVNAMINPTDSKAPDFITTAILDENEDQMHFINVQPLHQALGIKMNLGRPKDKEFMLGFINFLTSL